MSGASISIAGASAFQIGITLSVGPPLSYFTGTSGVRGSCSEALTYIGRGYTAFPTAATCPTYLATAHAWKYTSASGPKTVSQFEPGAIDVLPMALRISGGTDSLK